MYIEIVPRSPPDPCHCNEDTLRLAKGEIEHTAGWERSKWLTNPFEQIGSFGPCVFNNRMDPRFPASRAFYKLWELSHDLIDTYFSSLKKDTPLNFAYLAEAPGAFIECMVSLRHKLHAPASTDDENDKHVGISLASRRYAVPHWRLPRSWCKRNNVALCTGADRTGDLYVRDNIESFVESFGERQVHFVTGDGGFDFSSSFDDQEKNMLRLIATELYVGLRLLRHDGVIIVKIFDFFLQETRSLLALVQTCFEGVMICKPTSSRPANSEKYLLAKDPNHNRDRVMERLERFIFHSHPLPELETSELAHVGAAFAQKQIANIRNTVRVCRAEPPASSQNETARLQTQAASAWWQDKLPLL